MKIRDLVIENDMASFFKNLQKNDPKFKNLRIHGDPDHDELRKQDELQRQTNRAEQEKKGQQAQADQVGRDRAALPQLQKQLQDMTAKFDQLGGTSYQYADRMMPRDLEAQDLHRQINVLKRRIDQAGQDAQESASGGSSSSGSIAQGPGKGRPDSIVV